MSARRATDGITSPTCSCPHLPDRAHGRAEEARRMSAGRGAIQQAIGWLAGAIEREHPGFLAQQIKFAEEYEARHGNTGVADGLRALAAERVTEQVTR